MTDFSKVNNVYYDMNVYNPTSTPIEVSVNNKLLYPLLNNADDYSVSLAKAKIPLQNVPLTTYNIPLKQYQVGLKYDLIEEFSYVRQVGANQNNFVWNCPKGSTIISKYSYSPTGVLTFVSSQDLSLLLGEVYNFVVDDYQNLFILGASSQSEVVDTLYVIDENLNLLQTTKYTLLKHIFIDRGQNLYICDESTTPSVYIYSMNNSIGSVNLTLKATLTTNFAGNPLKNLLFCVADFKLIVGYDQNTITLYDDQYNPYTDITEQNIKQFQNVASISTIGNTYVLADSNEIDDTLFGTSGVGNLPIYNVNNNQEIAVGSLISQFCLTTPQSGYGWALGNDNHLYEVSYPITNPPATWTQANGTYTLRAIYSYQKVGTLFGCGQSNLYYAWNFNVGKNTAYQNTWSQLGEWEPVISQQVSPNSMDVQSTTNKIILSGTDNKLYQSQYAVYPFECIFLNLADGTSNNKIYGINASNFLQNSAIQRSFGLQGSNIYGIFKRAVSFYTSEYSGTGVDFNQYDLNFNLVKSYPNLDNNIGNLTHLFSSNYFVYWNNSNNIVVRNLSNPNQIIQTYPIPDQSTTTGPFCDLDANHFAVLVNGGAYVFNYTQTTPILNVVIPNDGYDIVASLSDSVNGAAKLFCVANNANPNIGFTNCTEIYSITFTDNTYTAYNAPQLIYTETRQNQTISYIQRHEGINGIIFLSANSTNETSPTELNMNYLYQSGGYSANSMVSVPLQTPPQSFGIQKPYVYHLYSVSAPHLFNQITSNITINSVSVSRSNPNKLYAINSSDSQIYQGTLLNGSVNFTLINLFAGQTYAQISNTPNSDPNIQSTLYLYGLISQNLITSLTLSDECGDIARNDVNDQYMISYRNSNKIQALNATNLTSVFTTPLTGSYRIFTKNGSDIDVGPVSIYNMSVFVDAINTALLEATNKLNQSLGSTTITTPPTLTLNYQTGLCTLNYPTNLTGPNAGILFNQNLLNLVYYRSSLDPASGLFQLLLNPQAESITQNVKTINQFNQLDKILFRSDTIFVVGAYFGINDSNNIFFDIDCPTSDWVENVDQVLYFQPNFLRTYFLRSNLPLDNIQLRVYYQYRDGTQYQLYINNGQNVSVKLQFVKKF